MFPRKHLHEFASVAGVAIALVGFLTSRPTSAADNLPGAPPQGSLRLIPEDAVRIATGHWNHLQHLRREYSKTLQELLAATDGDGGNPKLAAQLAIMSRLVRAELELGDTITARQEACQKFLRDVDALKPASGPAAKSSELMVKAARQAMEIELERMKNGDRSPEEVQALVDQARTAGRTYDEVFAKFNVGARGGEAEKEASTGCVFCCRLAELLVAIGQPEDAVKRLKQACEYANRAVQATQAAYEAGTVTLDLVLASQKEQADVRIALAKLDRKAAAEAQGK